MSDKSNKKRLLFDCILIGALLCIGLSALLILNAFKEPGTTVCVWVDNRLVSEYPLGIDGEYSLNDGTNILKIEDGRARVTEANCPKQVCVNRGEISYTYEKIVCAHNKIEITVE